MYSKSSNPSHPTYSQLSQDTHVCIVGSGKLSGVLLVYGKLSKTPEYTQTDQINRFTTLINVNMKTLMYGNFP